MLHINAQQDTADIVTLTRDNYSRSTFLDDRLDHATDITSVSLSELKTAANQHLPPRQMGFIFHIAFCGSTLLSRCLDQPGICLPYKEPAILHALSHYKRSLEEQGYDIDVNEQLSLCLALLGRTFSATEIPVIKPSDTCNNMIGPFISHHPDNAGLLLYRNLRPYALSMLEHPSRRGFMRQCLDRGRMDLKRLGILQEVDTSTLNDAQTAAYLWLSQLYLYQYWLLQPELNLRSLNAEEFYHQPDNTLQHVAELFRLNLTQQDITAIMSSGIMDRDAKDSMSDSSFQSRAAMKKRIAEDIADELDECEAWVKPYIEKYPLDYPLPRNLLKSKSN